MSAIKIYLIDYNSFLLKLIGYMHNILAVFSALRIIQTVAIVIVLFDLIEFGIFLFLHIKIECNKEKR